MSAPASPLVRLPDPQGEALGNGAENTWTLGLDLDASGTYLAQTYFNISKITAGQGFRLAFYTRTGDQFVRGTVPPLAPGQSPPASLAWSPDGRYLCTTSGDSITEQASQDLYGRLWMYRRDGTALVSLGPGPTEARIKGAGYASNTTVAWSCDGRHVAAADILYGGWGGVLAHDGAGGLTVVAQFPEPGWRCVAWHPKNPEVLAAIGQYGRLYFYRLAGDELIEIWSDDYNFAYGVQWHPSGDYLAVAAFLFCTALMPVMYSWDGNQASPQGGLWDFGYCFNGYAFSRAGDYLAGGWVLPDLNVYNFEGLTVAAIDVTKGVTNYNSADPYAGYATYARLSGADQIFGNINAWGAGDGGVILASSAYPGPPGGFDPAETRWQSAWGFHTYRLGAGAARPSYLWQADRAGAFRNVGTAAVPLGMAQADGSMRVWPASPAPLLLKQPDGSWREVIPGAAS